MPRGKQFVFSARTTAEGLKTLNGLKARLEVNWDGLIIDAINAHYKVNVPKPPRVGPTPEERAVARVAKDVEKATKAEERARAAEKAKAAKPKAEKKPKADAKKAVNKTAKESVKELAVEVAFRPGEPLELAEQAEGRKAKKARKMAEKKAKKVAEKPVGAGEDYVSSGKPVRTEAAKGEPVAAKAKS